MLGAMGSLDGASPVITSDGVFGFAWKKQARWFRANMKQTRAKVSISLRFVANGGVWGSLSTTIPMDAFVPSVARL